MTVSDRDLAPLTAAVHYAPNGLEMLKFWMGEKLLGDESSRENISPP